MVVIVRGPSPNPLNSGLGIVVICSEKELVRGLSEGISNLCWWIKIEVAAVAAQFHSEDTGGRGKVFMNHESRYEFVVCCVDLLKMYLKVKIDGTDTKR